VEALQRVAIIDVQDSSLPLMFYHLLFALVAGGRGIKGNDQWYELGPDDLSLAYYWTEDIRKRFDDSIYVMNQGGETRELPALKERFKDRKPTLEEAIEEFRVWLKEHGVNSNKEHFFVKIWW